MSARFDVEVDGLRIPVWTTGDAGPRVLLIHGNSSSRRSYAHQVSSSLSERYTLVTMDLPGHGDASWLPEGGGLRYSARLWVRCIVAVANKVGAQVLAGHSMGGHLAIESAPQLPNTLGVAVFGTPPFAKPIKLEECYLSTEILGTFFSPHPSEESLAKVGPSFVAAGNPVPPELLKDFRATDPRVRADIPVTLQAGEYDDEVVIARTLGVPIAFFHGAEETIVDGAYLDGLECPTRWRNRVERLQHAGHLPHQEQPAAFNALLGAFLHDVAPSPVPARKA